MSSISPEELLRKWDYDANQTPIEASTLPHRFELQALRLLALGEPVSAEMVASKLGIPAGIAQSVFEASRGKGQWDAEGRLIGSALTLVPTPHHFRIMDRDLYTWCAHDAIFLPGLLGAVAEVESPDPLSGERINLRIGPQGPETYNPESAVLTILQSAEPATGPDSPVCINSHFFTSRASAEEWSKDQKGVEIMLIEDAFAQVKENLLDAVQPILNELE